MGIGDHAPPPRARKPVTKKQLQKIREGYARSQEIIETVREREAEERSREAARLDAAIEDEF